MKLSLNVCLSKRAHYLSLIKDSLFVSQKRQPIWIVCPFLSFTKGKLPFPQGVHIICPSKRAIHFSKKRIHLSSNDDSLNWYMNNLFVLQKGQLIYSSLKTAHVSLKHKVKGATHSPKGQPVCPSIHLSLKKGTCSLFVPRKKQPICPSI